MKRSVSFRNLTWTDFSRPDSEDTTYLQENFDIHPLAIEEFMTPTFRPKATQYDKCLFLTVHIPIFDKKTRTTRPGELDIVITKDHLITGHVEKIIQLESFFSSLEESSGKRRLHMNRTPSHLLYRILEMLLESLFPNLDQINSKLLDIEEQVFNGKEKEMVFEISVIKRDILNFRRALKPQRSIIESLVQMKTQFVDPELVPYFQDLAGTNIRLWNTLESSKETIESLEDTNNSLLSNKLDFTMKVLTVFSAIMMPMTVYSNILAMSADIPFGKSPNAFVIHVSIMLFISALTITIFKIKKWL